MSHIAPACSALSFSFASLFYFHHYPALELAKNCNIIVNLQNMWESNHKNHFRLERKSKFYITFPSSKYPIINYEMQCVFTGCPKSALEGLVTLSEEWGRFTQRGISVRQLKGEGAMPAVSPHSRHKPRWPVPTQLIPWETSPYSFIDIHASSYSRLPVMCSTCSIGISEKQLSLFATSLALLQVSLTLELLPHLQLQSWVSCPRWQGRRPPVSLWRRVCW